MPCPDKFARRPLRCNDDVLLRRALQQRQTMRLRSRFAQTVDKVQGLRAQEIGRIDQPIAELFKWAAEQQAGAWRCQLYMHAFPRVVCLANDILPARARVEPAPAKNR